MIWLLPGRGVRAIGAGLVVAALVLPVVVIGARTWLSRRGMAAWTLRPAMVKLPAGTFRMGSPKEEKGRFDNEEQHDVTLSMPFAISVTEVTQGQYERVMGQGPSRFHGSSALPVENVSFYDALHYCNRLSRLEGLKECYRVEGEQVTWVDGLRCPGYRLPTEAEWEYAARAGTGALYAGGDKLDEVAWYGSNSGGRTHPVATLAGNAWGLYDMSGNVWEWVWDWYQPFSDTPAKDPIGLDTKTSGRVVRGGSWGAEPRRLRVSDRDWSNPGPRLANQGFRLSRSLP